MDCDRTDELMAQRVEVALIYQKMLGNDDARIYLSSAGVPQDVIERVLAGPKGRRIGPSDTLDAVNGPRLEDSPPEQVTQCPVSDGGATG